MRVHMKTSTTSSICKDDVTIVELGFCTEILHPNIRGIVTIFPYFPHTKWSYLGAIDGLQYPP
jgi:hypothetical protein